MLSLTTFKTRLTRRYRGGLALVPLLGFALLTTLVLMAFSPVAVTSANAAPYGYGSYGGYNSYGSYGYAQPRRRYYRKKTIRKRRKAVRRKHRRTVRRKPFTARRHIARRRGKKSTTYKPAKVVSFDKKYKKGSIIVDTSERNLYYVIGTGSAIRYRVAVGKPHMQWFGKTFVQLKRPNPGWTPTARMRRNGAPRYVPPGPNNPLGVRAINLGWSEYRIHGTNAPRSIGRAASSGCIRMRNSDVKDLFERVHIGAPVHVIR